MKLKVYSHVSEEETVFDVNSRSDLLKLASRYPTVEQKVKEAPSTEQGLHVLAKYLSRNHMDAVVVPDKDKVQDDFNVSSRKAGEIKDLDDAAKVLENDYEDLDIPEEVALRGSTHRWE